MPNHNTHEVGFKRMRMAGLLPAAALILAVFAPSTVSATEVKLAGAVVSGLFYSKAESAEHSNLVLAGVGETPNDTCFKILGREDLGNGYYVRFNLSSNVTPDTGSFSGHNGLFSSSYMSIGNQQFEVTAGRMSGLTVSGDPYSVYAATDANMTYAQLAGIAPQTLLSKPVRSLMRLHLQRMAADLSCAVFIQMVIQTSATAETRKRLKTGPTAAMWRSSAPCGLATNSRPRWFIRLKCPDNWPMQTVPAMFGAKTRMRFI